VTRTILILMLTLQAGAAQAMSDQSIERKEIMVSLCTGVIENYTRYLAGTFTPKNPVQLEREFKRCAETVDEYETLSR